MIEIIFHRKNKISPISHMQYYCWWWSGKMSAILFMPRYVNEVWPQNINEARLQYANEVKSQFHVKEGRHQYFNEGRRQYVKEVRPQYVKEVRPWYVKEVRPHYVNMVRPQYVNEVRPQYVKEIRPQYVKEVRPHYVNESGLNMSPGLIFWCPLVLVKSQQLIWRSGTHRFHPWAPSIFRRVAVTWLQDSAPR